MCGISGIIQWGSDLPVQSQWIENMIRVIRHRGPDDSGVYIDPVDGRCGLGHARLAIIDPDYAVQPMTNEDGTFWITYNGECYNFKDLRERLIAKGHTFKTRSDTEVIIHLYEQYGQSCVEHLRGMFALAIWDQKQKHLFLARDRLGQKPLYYTCYQGKFAFASQCKAILQIDNFPRKPDFATIGQYLLLQYVPAPRSGFEQIWQLPPAHTLLVTSDNYENPVPRPYWKIDPDHRFQGSFNEAVEEIRSKMHDATKLRMISDVPLGAFLSGGIDSTIIVGLMSKSQIQPVKTCSIGFTEDLYNELPWARHAAEHFQCDHSEYVVHPGSADTIEKLVDFYDEPFADCSALPTFHLSKLTRQQVKVALTGDGGDECFGGYDRYRACQIADQVNRSRLLRWVGRLNLWPHLQKGEHRSLFHRLHRFFDAAGLAVHQSYLKWMAVFNPDLIGQVLQDSTYNYFMKQNLWNFWKNEFSKNLSGPTTSVSQAMLCDAHYYLPSDLNTKTDRASMSVGLELRSPFQDHKIVELAYSLPPQWKIKNRLGKYILRKSFTRLIPKTIVHRKKLGFGVPVGKWFRSDLKPLFQDIVLSNRCIQRGYFKQSRIEQLLSENDQQQQDHGHKLWSLLMLELWHRNYIDQPPAR